MLTASESAVTHRRRYRGYVRPAGVLELLLLDPDNPRSLAFSLGRLRRAPGRAAGVDRLDPARAAARRPRRPSSRRPTWPRWSRSAASAGRNLQALLDATIAALDTARPRPSHELHFATGPAPRPLAR